MKNFLKSIVVGLGAVAPGLSGSILLILFGLYQKVVTAVSTFFRDIKRNLLFLLPILLGIGVGVILFSKLIVFFTDRFEMQTYYAFLGLILGALPVLYTEVRKEGFAKKYWIFVALSFVVGAAFFLLRGAAFEDVTDPNFAKSFLLGLVVAAAYLIPGVDSAAILSCFGLYQLWIGSIDAFDFSVLLPAALGVAVGGIAVSLLFHFLLSRFYTGTYSIIFGLFLSVILNFILRECPMPGANLRTVVSFILLALGFCFSFAFGHIERILAWLKAKRAENEKNEATE